MNTPSLSGVSRYSSYLAAPVAPAFVETPAPGRRLGDVLSAALGSTALVIVFAVLAAVAVLALTPSLFLVAALALPAVAPLVLVALGVALTRGVDASAAGEAAQT